MTFATSPSWARVTGESVVSVEMKTLFLTLGTRAKKQGGGIFAPYQPSRGYVKPGFSNNGCNVRPKKELWPWSVLKTGV